MCSLHMQLFIRIAEIWAFSYNVGEKDLYREWAPFIWTQSFLIFERRGFVYWIFSDWKVYHGWIWTALHRPIAREVFWSGRDDWNLYQRRPPRLCHHKSNQRGNLTPLNPKTKRTSPRLAGFHQGGDICHRSPLITYRHGPGANNARPIPKWYLATIGIGRFFVFSELVISEQLSDLTRHSQLCPPLSALYNCI